MPKPWFNRKPPPPDQSRASAINATRLDNAVMQSSGFAADIAALDTRVDAAELEIDGLQTAVAGKQPLDAELTAIAGLPSAADQMPYFTGLGTASTATVTGFARSILDDPDAATARATLGIPTASTSFFNVKDYGAIGDGSTDDTSAIQSTINAAGSALGGTVVFPGGVYIISSPIEITASNVHIVGYGANIRANYGNDNLIEIYGAGSTAFDSARSISIRGLSLSTTVSGVSGSVHTTSGAAVHIHNARDIVIRDLFIPQFASYSAPNVYNVAPYQFLTLGHGGGADNVKSVKVLGCYVGLQTTACAIELYAGSILEVRDCFFNNFGTPPSGSSSAAIGQANSGYNWDGLVVSGCTGEGMPRGIILILNTAGVANSRISDNIFEPVRDSQISCWPASGGYINNWTISGNVFNCSPSGSPAVGIRMTETYGGTIQNISISGNTFYHTGDEAIRIDEGACVSITGNTFFACGVNGAPALSIGAVDAVILAGNAIHWNGEGMTYAFNWTANALSQNRVGNSIVCNTGFQENDPGGYVD